MQENDMGKDRYADSPQRQCEYCQYFRENEYTGYCQIHHAYVIKAFVCEKFVSHHQSTKGA